MLEPASPSRKSSQKSNLHNSDLSGLGEKIFLDRYALKDGTRKSLKVGDVVVALIDEKSSQREVATVSKIEKGTVTVELKDGGNLNVPLEHVDKPLETRPEQMMARVARGAAAVEVDSKKEEWTEKFEWLLKGWKFVPGGRILTGCGTDQNLTFYNCYVVPSPTDSRHGIMDTLTQMTEIMSRGGGVGINLSSLRPRHAYVKGVNGRSSGSVSWGGLYSFVTGLIEQGGSRRGALMLILNVWHPDILEFITAKKTMGRITNANISVGVTDDFMEAVEKDLEWNLRFPDTSDEKYKTRWKGDMSLWEKEGGKTIPYKTVRAKDVWNDIIESAWHSAEPGLWFADRCNKDSNSYYYDEGQLICTNPCGEQPLPGWAVCNLGHINLAKFVTEKKEVDWDNLKTTVQYAVRFLDNVIDATPYFFKENEKQQKDERRVGMGTIGLAEMLIRCGMKYGSPESEKFIEKLYSFIAKEAYLASSEYAGEKGSFKKFDADKFLDSGFMKRMPEEVRQSVRKKGARNVTLLTQAPTGTVGTMVGTSTGIEPFYCWSYFRKSRLGMHEERVKVYEDWLNANPGKELPEYFANAMELTPEEHVNVQAATQRWVDSAISKTCNVPSEYTVEQTKTLYEYMYKSGCKGGTIYRDKSRDEQVLYTKDNEKAKEEAGKVQAALSAAAPAPAPVAAPAPVNEPKVRPRPHMRRGVTISKVTPAGTAHITMNDDEQGRPLEVFIEIGKGGSDLKAMAEALGRLCSLVLRVSSPLSPEERVGEIVSQFRGIGGQRSAGFGMSRVRSLPDALAQAMEERYLNAEPEANAAPAPIAAKPVKKGKRAGASVETQESGLESVADLCPSCGNTSFVFTEGCTTCYSCGHSEC